MRLLTLSLLSAILLISVGCGGGSATTPVNPDPLVQVTGIRPSQGLDANTPGYAGDELSIQALITGEVPASIVWDFGGGAIPVSLDDADMPTVELGAAGDYVGRVTVTDSAGNTDSFEFDYTILPESHRIKGISPANPAGFLLEPVQFSVEVDGEVEFATWSFRSGSDAAEVLGATPQVQLTEVGTHEVELTITIKNGPTVRRTFPFTVVANPWQEFQRVPGRHLIEMLPLSNGEIALLTAKSDEAGPAQVELLRFAPGELSSPETWQSQRIGTSTYQTWIADVHEHQGRIGVLYHDRTGTGSEHGNLGHFFAVSTDLDPAAPSDWTTSRVSGFEDFGQLALSAGSGNGWNVLFSWSGFGMWSTTNEMAPATDDWVTGNYVAFPQASITRLFMQLTGEALVCAVETNRNQREMRVGAPANFTQVMASPPYNFGGEVTKLVARNGRMAALVNRSDQARLLAITSSGAPALADWNLLPIDKRLPDSTMVDLALGEDRVYVLRQTNIDRPVNDFSYLELLSHSLDPTAGEWSAQGVAATDWREPLILPLGASPVLAWKSADSDVKDLIWSHLAE